MFFSYILSQQKILGYIADYIVATGCCGVSVAMITTSFLQVLTSANLWFLKCDLLHLSS